MGVLYGTTSVCVGHPFDTIKTKMQAQQGFENRSMLRSFAKTVQEQGIRGLYRGCLPPLFGSGIFRSTQFAVFESVYTYMDVPFGKYELPLTGGLQVRVGPPPSSTSSLLVMNTVLTEFSQLVSQSESGILLALTVARTQWCGTKRTKQMH